MEWLIGLFILWLFVSLSGKRPPKSETDRKSKRSEEIDSEVRRLSEKAEEKYSEARRQFEEALKTHDNKRINPSSKTPRKSLNQVRTEVKSPGHTSPQTPNLDQVPSKQKPNSRKNSREHEIRKIVETRQIQYLLHFTRVENIPTILRHGLVGRKSIAEKNIRSRFNDDYRFDWLPDAICTSISFPNYQLFYRFQNLNPEVDWAVLKLDCSLLWKKRCVFCVSNAATARNAALPIETRMQPHALNAMFADFPPPRTRNNLRLPDSFPTDPQAEVLILDPVGTGYIHSIHLNEKQKIIDQLRVVECTKSFIDPKQIFYGSHFFRPREDYSHWTKYRPSSAEDLNIPF